MGYFFFLYWKLLVPISNTSRERGKKSRRVAVTVMTAATERSVHKGCSSGILLIVSQYISNSLQDSELSGCATLHDFCKYFWLYACIWSSEKLFTTVRHPLSQPQWHSIVTDVIPSSPLISENRGVKNIPPVLLTKWLIEKCFCEHGTMYSSELKASILILIVWDSLISKWVWCLHSCVMGSNRKIPACLEVKVH